MMHTLVNVAQSSDITAIRIMAKAYQDELSKFYQPDACVPVMSADTWFQREPPSLFVIRACDAIAGFAVVVIDQKPIDVCTAGNYFAELYVIPRFRKSSVPMQAASRIVRTYPGEWSTHILEANNDSLLFVCALADRICGEHSLDIVETPAGRAWECRFTVRG